MINKIIEEMMSKSGKNIISEDIKKSSLHAKDEFDILKLQNAGDKFLDVNIKDASESLVFDYDVNNLKAVKELGDETFDTKVTVLMSISDLLKEAREFDFDITPENIYYSATGKTFIKSRDIKVTDKNNNLEQYKAVVGAFMQNKYAYKDYLEGGKDLYKKDKELSKICDLRNGDEVVRFLLENKKKTLDEKKQKEKVVNKKSYRLTKTFAIVFGILTLLLGAYAGYEYFYELPYLNASKQAEEAYVDGDIAKEIEVLENIDVSRLNKIQKYMLAKAYVTSESLSSNQKDIIYEKLSSKSDTRILEYWIYLGRRNLKKAENLAMQMSDDELLIYAYMVEKDRVEVDKNISGDEKASKIKDLEGKIEELSKKYNDNKKN